MANLKIPSLHMNHLQFVSESGDPFPAASPIGCKLIETHDLASFACIGILDAMFARPTSNVLNTFWRRLDHFGWRVWIPIVNPIFYQLQPCRCSCSLPREKPPYFWRCADSFSWFFSC